MEIVVIAVAVVALVVAWVRHRPKPPVDVPQKLGGGPRDESPSDIPEQQE